MLFIQLIRYCLSTRYYVVYPADTMLFIQLIRYCLSTRYYVVYPADTMLFIQLIRYCLSTRYYVVYPADTMLFIQLIRYCLSTRYYVVYPADTIVTVICFYTMLCICDKYLLCLVCIGYAYIIYILQDTYNTLFFNNPDNLFNRY